MVKNKVLIWKTEVCITTRYCLSITKKSEEFKYTENC